MVVRIVLLLIALSGLTVFVLQNSTVLQLRFLGMRTQALPFGFWILAAVAAGVLTALGIAWLLQIINSWGNAKLRTRIRQLEAEKLSYQGQSRETDSSAYQSYSYSPASSSTANAANSSANDSGSNEEWKEEDEEEDFNYDRSTSNFASDVSDVSERNYEAKQEPTSGYHSGSVYSYSYKNPSDSAVGKTESVYDAEYRVITPPYRPLDTEEEDNIPDSPPTNPQNKDDNDDWGFDDDDDFDDDLEDNT
jgi:uncharacterized integral membrane protein